NVVILILTGNPISYIAPDSLNSLHKLQRLLLVDIGLLSLNAQFSNLTNLQELKVGTNKIQTIALPQFMINFKDFRVLDLHANNISSLKVNHTVVLREMRGNITLILSSNPILHIEPGVFQDIYLKELNILNLSHVHSLEKLVVVDNKAALFHGLSDMPKLKHVDLSRNQMILQECCSLYFRNAPNIRHINLSHNAKIWLNAKPFFNLELVEELDFHHTVLDLIGQTGVLQNLKNLKYLDLSYTRTVFSSYLAFHGLQSIKIIKIAGNTFQGTTLTDLFENLTALEVLDMSHCGIDQIPCIAFRNLQKLRQLLLSQNNLMVLDFLTQPNIQSLTHLAVDQNSISAIKLSTLQNLPLNLSVFDITSNPISCFCTQTDFVLWIVKHKKLFPNSNNILCKTLWSDSKIRLIDFDVKDCVHIRRLTIVLCICAAIFLILASVLTYKFQFYLRYAYILLRGYNVTRQQEFSYDAFVIYSSKDESWVMDELVENLENGCPPIQLCLHVRDFEAGKAITSNIIDEGIMGSRKIIVVVSKHFIESSWCRFEFEVAQSWLVMQGNANIIIIILEDVEEEKSKKVFGLHKHLRNNTYLKWSGNPVNNMRFWIRLRKAVIKRK
ncbi:toll-like receptor 4b, duplicate b precursor, partial [Silurus asotus]